MKIYYLFDGSEIKDFIIDEDNKEVECMKIFDERAKDDKYNCHSWVVDQLVTLNLEGKFVQGSNDICTIIINGKPTKAILNAKDKEKIKLFDYCYDNCSECRLKFDYIVMYL